MLIPQLYVSTVDDKNTGHQFRMPVTDTVPDGHEITAVRPAGQFRLSSLLSADSLATLKTVGRKNR